MNGHMMSPLASGRSPFRQPQPLTSTLPATSAMHWHAWWDGAQPRYVGDPVSSSGGWSCGLWQGGWLLVVDPAEESGQVCSGVVPVEWPGGLVVAVSEGEQRAGEVAEA